MAIKDVEGGDLSTSEPSGDTGGTDPQVETSLAGPHLAEASGEKTSLGEGGPMLHKRWPRPSAATITKPIQSSGKDTIAAGLRYGEVLIKSRYSALPQSVAPSGSPPGNCRHAFVDHHGRSFPRMPVEFEGYTQRVCGDSDAGDEDTVTVWNFLQLVDSTLFREIRRIS